MPSVSRRPRPLEDFRERDAYVLLGAPGAGKTVEFEREAGREGGCYVTARDFITFADRPEWHGTTLFIDGLDEVRAGAADGRTPLEAIRFRLDALGRPRFRLSCREADWFGANDRRHLESVSPSGEVTVLRPRSAVLRRHPYASEALFRYRRCGRVRERGPAARDRLPAHEPAKPRDVGGRRRGREVAGDQDGDLRAGG